jgi:hypothetical protein
MDKHTIINLAHILLIVPFFIYIGIVKYDVPELIFNILIGLGIYVIIYHGYNLLVRFQQKSGFAWVNALHFLYIGPLLIYIGYKKKETPRSAFEILLLFAFAAGGYHLYEFAAYSSMNSKQSGGSSETVVRSEKVVDMKNTSS